jgi:alanyl-tRNA synthetase
MQASWTKRLCCGKWRVNKRDHEFRTGGWTMKKLTGKEIRQLYKQFFAERGHLVMPSASLVPHDDPSLLWINAGMAPLKPYFDGREIPECPRIVSSQKCIRTNDIENVGHTARHQTFFEMLGNFSFGDYFKKEAISWAYEFLTEWLEMDPNRLSVTVHVDDDEAYGYWHDICKIPAERIYRGTDDNFWEIGEGPCGPCSEIFFDRGEEFGCGSADCKPGCDCDRFLEIWNLVFTQYNKEADGSYTPLPKKNIDTGSGLERLASVLQEVPTNFDTDLFRTIIDATSKLIGVPYGVDSANDVHFKIIADHIRTVTFAIGDGVLPGNEGRSYIIRRLLRRAVRSGRRLGYEKPFLHQLTPVVAELMGDDYPEVREKLDFIRRVVRTEEERFHETLVEGEALLLDTVTRLKAEGKEQMSAEDAFRLYDTFGFPIDLTEEITSEHGISVDREGFSQLLEEQRQRARQARQLTEGMNNERGVLENITVESEFVGYRQLKTESRVVALLQDGAEVKEIHQGEEGQLMLDITPFYAESGGQVADRGTLRSDDVDVEILDVRKAPHGQHLHTVRVLSGKIRIGDRVEAEVDTAFRKDIVKNHTATHLLHKALREVLGTHVAQAGSLVEDTRLRFDFSHFGAMTQEELDEVERRVNEAIWQDAPVVIREMPIDEAKAMGAMALFGEKYGSLVRVVQAGESIELCGGCHVERTGVIGLFRIVSEAGIGAGVRRIEAVTGRHAYQFVQSREGILRDAAELLKTTPNEVVVRVQRTLDDLRGALRELESAKAKLNHSKALELLNQIVHVGDIPVLTAIVPDTDVEGLRQTVDELKSKLNSYVIVLGTSNEDKVQLVAAVSKDLQGRKLHAGNIVKKVAELTGGGGGGRPDMAQAGGKDVSKLPSALETVAEIVRESAGITAS